MITFRILTRQPLRLAITVGGISLCIVLMLFLLAVYQGVADGSVEYIRGNASDLWVLQRNATNILRGSSLLRGVHGEVIRQVDGVESVSPVLLILSTVKKDDLSGTVFLAGFDLITAAGGPPHLFKGHTALSDDEIVLDKSFAARLHCEVGERVCIQDDTLEVVGLSEGTNACVIQYGFISIARAQLLIKVPGIVTCFLVKARRGLRVPEVARRIKEDLPDVEVYDHPTFLKNNIREMQSGFLPLLYTVAAIGAIVLTAILSLLLTISILEQRKEFGVMKTLGCPQGFLQWLVMRMSLSIAGLSSCLALVSFFPLIVVVERFRPEVSTKCNVEQIIIVLAVVTLMSLLSSVFSIRRLSRIYALEAFQ
jgi:ABC-type lipoprotein release transport system permease subunit